MLYQKKNAITEAQNEFVAKISCQARVKRERELAPTSVFLNSQRLSSSVGQTKENSR